MMIARLRSKRLLPMYTVAGATFFPSDSLMTRPFFASNVFPDQNLFSPPEMNRLNGSPGRPRTQPVVVPFGSLTAFAFKNACFKAPLEAFWSKSQIFLLGSADEARFGRARQSMNRTGLRIFNFFSILTVNDYA